MESEKGFELTTLSEEVNIAQQVTQYAPRQALDLRHMHTVALI